jgi:hypothetical protein
MAELAYQTSVTAPLTCTFRCARWSGCCPAQFTECELQPRGAGARSRVIKCAVNAPLIARASPGWLQLPHVSRWLEPGRSSSSMTPSVSAMRGRILARVPIIRVLSAAALHRKHGGHGSCHQLPVSTIRPISDRADYRPIRSAIRRLKRQASLPERPTRQSMSSPAG